MLLTSTHVRMFKSIDDSGEVQIDPLVTVLVGQNEAGKTAFLQALYKADPIDRLVNYNHIEDYPRKALSSYEPHHTTKPDVVATLTYKLEDDDLDAIHTELGLPWLTELEFSVNHKYDNTTTISLSISEKPYVEQVVRAASLPSEVATSALKADTIRDLIATLEAMDLNSEAQTFLAHLQNDFPEPQIKGWNLLQYKLWSEHLSNRLPKFLYFDEYYILPGKVNLVELESHQQASTLSNEEKTVLSLFQMAGVQLSTLLSPNGYEQSRAKLEAISNLISDKVFEYWTQNRDLEVLFDVRSDANDKPPFNNGNNLYVRIRNNRHRVSVPFDQRSKGFIWFFSFLVWFNGIKQQEESDRPLVLLLDEPGLSLHALGQADLLRYIDSLTNQHQLLYTTHSPFMVQSDRLHQVRTVQDTAREGTKISGNISTSDPNTIFPLQAALGYTIAQNLFIATRNLLVEGPADLVYLKYFSALLDEADRTSLRDDIIIVPVGGLNKLATFVALLRGNELELVVLHDYESKPDARLASLVRDKLISDKQILNYAMFRAPSIGKKPSTGTTLPSTDVEDIISIPQYLQLFNATFAKHLGSTQVSESDLPPGERIVDRLGRWLDAHSINLRASGGYNHYLVANYLASHPLTLKQVGKDVLDRMESIMVRVNGLFSS